MIIVVSRSGGVAAIRRTWRVDLDRESRSKAAEWQAIIDACPWSDAEDTDGDGVPDRFVYVIAVQESAGPDALKATLPEKRVVGPWRQLVERVQTAERRDT